MTTRTRRLSAEMREEIKARPIKNAELCDAVYDLDVADAERDAWRDKAVMEGEPGHETLWSDEAKWLEDELTKTRAELAAAQATIAERTEDAIVLGEKLKFCEMDNYTKGEAIEDYNQRLKEQAQKLTQQGAEIKHFHQMQLPDQSAMKAHIQECIEDAVAERDAVIAAMREAIGRTYIKEHGDGHIGWSYSCAHCGGADSIARDGGGMIVFTVHHPDKVTHKPDCIMVNTDTAQLAADHDAAVRRPLEAQIAKLQDRLDHAIAVVKLHKAFVDRIRAEERRKVLEEVKGIEDEAASLLIKKAAEALQMRTWKDDDPLDERLRLLGISLRDGYEKLRDRFRALAPSPQIFAPAAQPSSWRGTAL